MSRSQPSRRTKQKTYIRWVHKHGEYLSSILYAESELPRLRCETACRAKFADKDAPKTKLIKVRVTEIG